MEPQRALAGHRVRLQAVQYSSSRHLRLRAASMLEHPLCQQHTTIA
jgi:hypothetical protein